mgnify:CR=1 FL=1
MAVMSDQQKIDHYGEVHRRKDWEMWKAYQENKKKNKKEDNK